MTEKMASEILATLERIASAQEATALCLQVLFVNAAGPPTEAPAEKILMTQNGPVAY